MEPFYDFIFLFQLFFTFKNNSPASIVVKENAEQCFAVKFQKCFGGYGTVNTQFFISMGKLHSLGELLP